MIFLSTLLKNKHKHKFLSFKGLSSFIMREKFMQFRFFRFMLGNKALFSSLKNGILKDNGTHLQLSLNILGHPKPKKMLIFRFVGIFEYIILLILLMLILFLDICQNS